MLIGKKYSLVSASVQKLSAVYILQNMKAIIKLNKFSMLLGVLNARKDKIKENC